MSDFGRAFLDWERDKMRDLSRRTTDALAQLSDADINWRPNEESNSIENLVLHLVGNIQQRMVAGIQGLPDVRDRDAEFNTRDDMTRDQAIALVQEWFGLAADAMGQLPVTRLFDPLEVQSQQTTVHAVINTVVTHAAEHVGQMLYIAKLRLGSGFKGLSMQHKKALP